MSTLRSACGSFDGAYVLDAFAGSGALGIECISRGAAAAHFFERDRDALRRIAENVGNARDIFRPKRASFRADILKNPPVIGAVSPYDIVFLDPPYAYSFEDVMGLVLKLKDHGRLAPTMRGELRARRRGRSCRPFSIVARGSADILASKRFATTVIDLSCNVN